MAVNTHKSKSLMQMLDDELICGVCLELYNTPLMLPCGHNFCKLCVDGIVNSCYSFNTISVGLKTSFNCPMCQLPVSIHGRSTNELPVNRTLENVVSLYKNCSPVDIFDTSWNSDIPVTISSCIKHDHLKQDRFCEDCSTAMCYKCEENYVTDTNKHIHVVEPVQKLANSYQCEISNALTEMKKEIIPLNDRISLLEEMLSEIKHQETCVETQLEHNIASLTMLLRKQHELLKVNVEKVLSSVRRPVSEELMKCQAIKSNLQELWKKVYMVTKIRDVGVRIKLTKTLCQQLKLAGCDVLSAALNAHLPMVTVPPMDLSMQGVIDSINTLCWTVSQTVKPEHVDAGTEASVTEGDIDCDKFNKPEIKLHHITEFPPSPSSDILQSHSHNSINATFSAVKEEAPASTYPRGHCSGSLNDVLGDRASLKSTKLFQVSTFEGASNTVAISVAGQDRNMSLDFPAACHQVESIDSFTEKMLNLEMKEDHSVRTGQSFPFDSPSRANFEIPPADAWDFRNVKGRKDKFKKKTTRSYIKNS